MMNDEIILDFSALCRLAEQKKLSAEAEKYIYLLWLGLTEREAGMACYNPATKAVDLDDRTVFVKEEKIENCLSLSSGTSFSREELSAVHFARKHLQIGIFQYPLQAISAQTSRGQRSHKGNDAAHQAHR